MKTHKHIKYKSSRPATILLNSELGSIMVYLMERSFDLSLLRWFALADVTQVSEACCTFSLWSGGTGYLLTMRKILLQFGQ